MHATPDTHRPSPRPGDEVFEPGSPGISSGSAGIDEEFRRLLVEFFASAITYSHTVADRMGIGASDLRCWNLLAVTGPQTAGQMAELTGLTTGAVTRLIDRLEAVGVARRRHDLRDRRRVIVERAPGPDAVRHLIGPLARHLATLTESMPAEDLAAVQRFLQAAAPLLAESAAALRRPGRPQDCPHD